MVDGDVIDGDVIDGERTFWRWIHLPWEFVSIGHNVTGIDPEAHNNCKQISKHPFPKNRAC